MQSKCMRATNPRRLVVASRISTPRNVRAASTSQIRVDEHHAYCKDFVQKHDYDAYLVSHLYPADNRKGYFAIKAFYVCTEGPESMTCLMTPKQDELATVQDNVSGPILGEMRMQFWRDAVKSLAVVRHSSDAPLRSDERDIGQAPTSPYCTSVARRFAEY